MYKFSVFDKNVKKFGNIYLRWVFFYIIICFLFGGFLIFEILVCVCFLTNYKFQCLTGNLYYQH